MDENALLAYLLSGSDSHGISIEVPKPLNVRSYEELLSAHMAVLSKNFTGLLLNGKEVEDGVWLSRNVSLHPTAKITPPVYIGKNCKIGRGVNIGPYAVVGNNCVIDSQSIIADSIIFPGSYVGEALELRDVLIDKNRLISIRIGSELTLTEDFILGNLFKKKNVSAWCGKILSRSVASFFLLLTFPIFITIGFYYKFKHKGTLFSKSEVIRLPAAQDKKMWRTFLLFSFCRKKTLMTPPEHNKTLLGTESMPYPVGWRDFFCRFFPAMINIALGDLHFVGLAPKTKNEIEALSHDWRELYLKSKAGIVTEAMVNFGERLTEDELHSAEAIYSVSTGFVYDLKLLAKYCGQILGLVPTPVNEMSERFVP